MTIDRRTLLAAGALSVPLAAAGPAATKRPRIIATEEAFATLEWLDASERLPRTGPEATERNLLQNLFKVPALRQGLLDFDYRLKLMDQNGVDMHLLSLTTPGVQSFEPAAAVAMARRSNDQLAEIVRQHPTRFAALAAVAPQAPEAAAAEIERAMTKLGFSGVLINSYTDDQYLDHPKYDPLLAALARHDAPLYLHPRPPAPSMIGPYADYGLTGALWGFAADTGLHAMRLIMSGVFDRYPHLTVVLGHMGEAIPYWLWRIDNMFRKFRGAPTAAALGFRALKKLPSQYFRDNFYITTSGVDDHKTLAYALDQLGADRIMFAIDFPFEATEEAVAFLRTAPLTEEARHKIAHGNAERVFRIKPV